MPRLPKTCENDNNWYNSNIHDVNDEAVSLRSQSPTTLL